MKIVLAIIVFVCSGWSLDRFSRTSFDMGNLGAQFIADNDCEISGLLDKILRFQYNQSTDVIQVLLDDVEHVEYSPIQNLNKGKKNFSTCWSNGFVGFHENLAYNNRIVMKTIVQRPGFLCSGGSAKSVKEVSFEFIKDSLIVRKTNASYELNIASDSTCSFSRVQ